MRKFFRVLVLLSVISVLAGCSSKEADQPSKDATDDSDYVYDEPPAGLGFDISNEDIFDTGFYSIQYDTFDGAFIYFESNNEQDCDVEWYVYIVDDELDDSQIDELLTQEPIATNEGSASIESGQWIYVFCNINSKTAESPTNSTFNLYSFRDYA